MPIVLVVLLGLSVAAVYADVNGTVVAAKPATLRLTSTGKAAPFTALEQRVFEQINKVRAERGLDAVDPAQDLRAAARDHSNYMASANRLTHRGAGGRGAGERLDAAGIAWRRYGENVGLVKGYADPCRTVVDAWLRSPGHAANILNPSLTESAVGVAVAADGTYYLTQVFVTRQTH
jgi:uncharacterized protein YkwD